ncbi:MAG: NYN domain-containing protein [Dehalococcoidia bacterium]|jgi:uncharacterized LabA/DUF88 family protein|nr:NYN domain-containing protein [Dehalococcoidia bacterium]
MSEPMIWEPVRGPAGEAEGSNGGNGGSDRGGRGGRRSSSIIARRRPAAKKDAAEETPQAKDDDSDEPRTPRRRRARPAGKATSEAASSESSDEAPEEAKPVRRRRSRAATAESTSDEPTAEETPAEAVVEEAEAPAAPRTRTRRAPATGVAAESAELGSMRALIEEQSRTLSELRAGMLVLGEQLDQSAQRARLGVFVDVPNVMYGLEPDEKPLDMGKLLNFLRKGRDLVRATAYSPVSDDPSEPLEQQKFVSPFVRYEYRIVTKPLKRFADGSIKGNFDVEMAIDMVTMADRLDVIAIVSGDADFARAVEVVQTRGVRVEVVAFAGSSSLEMRSLADRYIELGAVIDQVR